VFSSREELAGDERVPLVGIALNKVPAVAPLKTLPDEGAERLGLSLTDARRRAAEITARLTEDQGLSARIRGIYAGRGEGGYRDPDLNIYAGGFFGDEDRAIFEGIHTTPPEALLREPPSFADPRGPEMLRRYVARNWPEVLSPAERRRWHSQCAGRLLAPEYDGATDIETYRKRLANMMARNDYSARDKTILKDLLDYAEWLTEHILH
jgi:exodeoxyribonuclease I